VVRIKAQLTIQYLASFIFFISLVVLVYLAYSANIPKFVKEVERENIYSKAYQLSEVLINNYGDPVDWTANNVNRIGLSDHYSKKPNLIHKEKIEELATFYTNNGFSGIQKKLAMNTSFSIFIFNITENGERMPLFDCSPAAFPRGAVNATVKRIAALNNSGKIELAEIIVQM
jgi:hypothetical protein